MLAFSMWGMLQWLLTWIVGPFLTIVGVTWLGIFLREDLKVKMDPLKWILYSWLISVAVYIAVQLSAGRGLILALLLLVIALIANVASVIKRGSTEDTESELQDYRHED